MCNERQPIAVSQDNLARPTFQEAVILISGFIIVISVTGICFSVLWRIGPD